MLHLWDKLLAIFELEVLLAQVPFSIICVDYPVFTPCLKCWADLDAYERIILHSPAFTLEVTLMLDANHRLKSNILLFVP